MEPVLYPYKVIGSDALLRHNHQDYREGDTVELTYDAAFSNKWLLEPLSEEGAFEKTTSVEEKTLLTMRGHERLSVLEGRKADLEGQLRKVDEQIAAAKKTVEEEKAKRRPVSATGQPVVAQAPPAKK